MNESEQLKQVLKEAEEARQKSRLDMFAAAALQGLLSNPDCDADYIGYAKDAWRYAKSMIEQEPKPK